MDISLNSDTVVSLITLATSIVAGAYALLAHRSAAGANRAVNNRGPHEPVLYEMVRETYARMLLIDNWKHDREKGPLGNNEKVQSFVSGVDDLGKIVRRLDATAKELKDDVRKYGCPVRLGQLDKPPTECINK